MRCSGLQIASSSVLCLALAHSAGASLSISPLFALIYSEGEATQVRVSTDEIRPKKYVIDWMEEKAPEGGSLTDLQKMQIEDAELLKEIISVRPKMFYMGKSRPSTRVIVQENYPALERVLETRNLNGEYRGYVRVSADSVAPLAPEGVAETNEESLSISLQFQYSLAIPVIYRIGNLDVRGSIAEFVFDPEKSSLDVKIEREGNTGLYGYVELEGYSSNGRKVSFGRSSTSVITRHESSKNFSIQVQPAGDNVKVMRNSDLILRHVPAEETGVSQPFETYISYRDAVDMGLIDVLNDST